MCHRFLRDIVVKNKYHLKKHDFSQEHAKTFAKERIRVNNRLLVEVTVSIMILMLMGRFAFLMEHLTKSFVHNKQKTDEAGRVFILDVTLDRDQYILMNLCNADTETD